MPKNEPTENCPIHPSEPYVWGGHEWFCQSCFFGFAPESLYGKILEQVKAAQDNAVVEALGQEMEARAVEVTEKILEIIRDEAVQKVVATDDGKVVVLLGGNPKFNGTPSETLHWLEAKGVGGYDVYIPWLRVTFTARRYVELSTLVFPKK